MRRPPRFVALIVVLPALLLSGQPSSALPAPQSERLYLLSSDSDYLYWSADPADPELGVGTLSRVCGLNYAMPDAKPCLIGTDVATATRSYNLFFLPGTALDEKIAWTSATPLRFHLEGTVNTFGAPYTVRLVVQKSTGLTLSQPATQTTPGVWEGQVPAGSPLNIDEVNILGVRVTTQAPLATIELRLGGRSYLELPRPFAMQGVPDLGRADTHRPEPSSFQTATRTFGFNDRSWAVQSFTGQTGDLRTFSFDLPTKAEVFLAWVEVIDSSFVQSIRSGSPDPKNLLQGASITLSRDGEEIDHSGVGTASGGIGTESLSVLDLAPGPLDMSVEFADTDAGRSTPFSLHVLEVRGERTLRTMRWRFMHNLSNRIPVTATCPGAWEPLPLTDEVRSVALDLDWDAVSPLPNYTTRFTIPSVGDFPCSEAGTGDELRLTLPSAERVLYLGATPAYNSAHVSAYDTTFEMTARYTYTPPPAA